MLFRSITGGTISFRDLASAVNLTNNWRGSQLTNMAWSGNNALRLNNSTATNTITGGYNFNTGLGATNYYRLEMINGTNAVTGNGVTIGAGGSLFVSNTLASFSTVLTNLGVAALSDSTSTFSGGLYNQGTITNKNNI